MATTSTPITLIANTETAARTLIPLAETLDAPVWLPQKLTIKFAQWEQCDRIHFYQGSLKTLVMDLWQENSALVFAMATGIVVRLIADLLNDKRTDPAVLVMDDRGNQIISLCGGHGGGADRLTKMVAQLLQGQAVLTGYSSSHGFPAIDCLGVPFQWQLGECNPTVASAKFVQTNQLRVRQTAGSILWQQSWKNLGVLALTDNHPFVEITINTITSNSAIVYHPRVLWVGIGCERGTDFRLIDQGLSQVLANYNLSSQAIAAFTTLDLKGDEPALLTLAANYHVPLKTFTPKELAGIPVPNPSETVAEEVGTPSVAEASALKGANFGEELGLGSLGALVPTELLVAKQVIKNSDYKGAATIAIAISPWEYLTNPGSLALVGTGPGALDQITPAAQTAIAQADVIIGYGLYLELIEPLCSPEQIKISLPITQERQRATIAIALARWGLKVAVVSSGDCGIYGMAGLVMEELQLTHWDGKSPQVKVYPGITALQSVAARVGTPLMHDFCAISLSDLLTPWPVIVKRLNAAAAGDFVVALYNPKSQQRTKQIYQAQKIFLTSRSASTPVALVKSAYRPQEQITITTLGEMMDHDIDMLTTVLIGNSNTMNYHNWLITPRGYNQF